jgi:hypothetical protein
MLWRDCLWSPVERSCPTHGKSLWTQFLIWTTYPPNGLAKELLLWWSFSLKSSLFGVTRGDGETLNVIAPSLKRKTLSPLSRGSPTAVKPVVVSKTTTVTTVPLSATSSSSVQKKYLHQNNQLKRQWPHDFNCKYYTLKIDVKCFFTKFNKSWTYYKKQMSEIWAIHNHEPKK